MTSKNTFKEHVLRVVAVVGLIAVLLLGAWGIIQLAFFIPTFLTNLAGGVTPVPAVSEKLVVTLPTAVTSGQTLTLSWSHTGGNGEYSYSASYSCVSGISIKAALPTGVLESVPCSTPFNYTAATSKLPLVVSNTGSASASVAFTVSATKLSSGAVTSTGSASTVVSAPEKAATPAKKTPAKSPAATKYVASAQPRAVLYGYPDLQVRILSNLGTVRAGSQVSLQFVVENVGTNVAPKNWAFTASLPYSPVYTYQSQGQQALYPGDKIVYTLGYAATPANNQVCTMQYPNYNCPAAGYTDPAAGWNYGTDPNAWMYGGTYNPNYNQNYGYGQTSTASVSVDPMNYVSELNESNNYAAISYQVY